MAGTHTQLQLNSQKTTEIANKHLKKVPNFTNNQEKK